MTDDPPPWSGGPPCPFCGWSAVYHEWDKEGRVICPVETAEYEGDGG